MPNLGDECKPVANFLRWRLLLLLLTFGMKSRNFIRGNNGACRLWRTGGRCWLEMRLSDLEKNSLHSSVAGLQVFNGLLNRRNKRLLAIACHFGMHAIAFASDGGQGKRQNLQISKRTTSKEGMIKSCEKSKLTVGSPTGPASVASVLQTRRYTHRSSS